MREDGARFDTAQFPWFGSARRWATVTTLLAALLLWWLALPASQPSTGSFLGSTAAGIDGGCRCGWLQVHRPSHPELHPSPETLPAGSAAPTASRRVAPLRTPNFLVVAPTIEAARAVAKRAEECRRQQALDWLGRELPRWSQPCRIVVKLTGGPPGGLTSFGFDNSGVIDRDMSVEGALERILTSALPHEVTHTVLADHFGGPMPRWADEGAALCSECDEERRRHDQFAHRALTQGKALPLSTLFRTEDYPRDLMSFYGQGYSVSRFLIETGGKPRFLKFVGDGSSGDWDKAVQVHYGFASVRELDRAWRAWHKVVVARHAHLDPTPPDSQQNRSHDAPPGRASSPSATSTR